MALFRVPRYMGEDEGEGTVKTVMTLEELHAIAKERAKSLSRKESENLKRGKSKRESNDLKGKKRRKHEDVVETETSRDKRLKRKSREKVRKREEELAEIIEEVAREEEGNEEDTENEEEEEDNGEEEEEDNEEGEEGKGEEMNKDTPIDSGDEDNPLPMVTHCTKPQASSRVTYNHLPDWAINSYHIESDIAGHSKPLESFTLNHVITRNLQRMNINKLFPVQCVVIPELLSSCHGPLLSTSSGVAPPDVCVCAPTGCGKTLSYVVPIVSSLLDRVTRELKALVVVPSKDLAWQVYKVFLSVSKGTRVKIGIVGHGNTSFVVEQEKLVNRLGSQVDVLIATPGRLVKHLQETPFFSLGCLRFLVIDEADRIFEQSYHNWLSCVMESVSGAKSSSHCPLSTSCVPRIYPNLWKPSFAKTLLGTAKLMHTVTQSSCLMDDIMYPNLPLQKLLFSATLSLDPEQLHLLKLHRPKLYTAVPVRQEDLGQSLLPSTLKEYAICCSSDYKPLVLLHLILTFGHHRILCFTHSRESTHRLTLLLLEYNAPVAEVSAELSKEKKNELIKRLTGGNLKVCYCCCLMHNSYCIYDFAIQT